jgi:hypothetical protein
LINPFHEQDYTKQIRRPFDDELDCLPNYPTIVLLMGVCHIVRYNDHKVRLKGAAKKGHEVSAEKRRVGAQNHLDKHFATIRQMLEANATNREIAEAIAVSESTLIRRFEASEELLKLALARPRCGEDSSIGRCKAKRQRETA